MAQRRRTRPTWHISAFGLISAGVIALGSPALADERSDNQGRAAVPASESTESPPTEPYADDTFIEPDSLPKLAAPAEPPAQSDPGAPTASGQPNASNIAPNESGPNVGELPVEQPIALPTGADKSGVTSKTISVPKGAGTIKGMEESFSAQLSTGIATFSVPFALPAARGGAQPSLGLSYSSSGGFGLAGVGWQVGVPFIARQTDRGVPGYQDEASYHANQDRFVFNGGQELVPICVVSGGACGGALANEVMPAWAEGWQYFRARVEGSFLRFFWSPDHLTWRVQDKSGVSMELGVPLDGSGNQDALEQNPDKPTEIYRWCLVRQYDTYGDPNPASGNPAPVNVVRYQYFQNGGTAYLSDIFATPPETNAATAPLSDYAMHARLVYEARTDPTQSYRSGWRIEQSLRLARVDVAAASFNDGTAGPRRMVRRYHLSYDPTSHASLLASVQVEGRCGSGPVDETAAHAEGSGLLPEVTGCPRLPAMTFQYGRVTPYTTSGAPGVADLIGYEGFDERLITMSASPAHSVDEQLTDLYDVNSDSLPDVLVTAPGLYGSGHGVFFNGAGGIGSSFSGAQAMCVAGVLGAGANTIKLSNLNVAPLDLDGDATINLLHMPKVKTYAVYSPTEDASGWCWSGRAVTTASGQSPKIDFGKDTLDTKVMDVNFDGLVDVVVTTGTEVQTFFALGRYPGGDGQFGQASWTSATTAQISNEPVRSCVPWSAQPIRFSDPDVKLADMNGDGVTDIVRVRKGDIRYWPGRGNGFWGTGKRDDCPGGTFGANRHITMTTSPQYSDVSGESLRLDDVNGDGLSDLVQVRFTDVDVWLNVDGSGWTQRHIIAGTPASPSFANRVRLVDVNGSGTRDILWGNAGSYRYMDLAGGERPHVLTRVDNGLGKSTALEYSTTATEMLAAEAAADPWQKRMPVSAHVVKRVIETDNNVLAGSAAGTYITEYSYRDPVFEARQREFRGFSYAEARRLGDANSPTDVTATTFLLGECVDETADGTDDCAVEQRWQDNPREALKGLPIITEKRDDGATYHSGEHKTYRLRTLYTGLDGRLVRHAFEQASQTVLYDVANFSLGETQVSVTTVEVEPSPLEDGTGPPDPTLTQTSTFIQRMSGGVATVGSSSVVDVYGNKRLAINEGCTSGCANGSADEIITKTTEPALVGGDPTGWLWRTASSKVSGNQYFLGDLQEMAYVYTPQGAVAESVTTLANTVALDRFHAAAGAVAPTPGAASTDGLIVWVNTYDDFGNLIQEEGPNDRCRAISYEGDYLDLPISETIYTGGCGNNQLVTAAMYDRGLGLVTIATDMQGQSTKVAYDGFGRLSELTKPHPDQAGVLSPEPAVIVTYHLPPDLGSPSAPAYHSIIHTKTQDGPGLSDTQYLESYSYVDGFGRTLLTLSEADPSEGDGGNWIVGGQVTFDSKGALAAKYLEYFTNASPLSFPLATAPTSPRGHQTYDAFGRKAVTVDLDGTVTLQNFYHALSTDHWDAEDLNSGGNHAGTYASETRDGHGRVVLTEERFLDPTLMTRQLWTTYLPTNEPLTLTRKLAGTSSEVVRWMRYDSIGRLVLNVEPNTSDNFTTDHTADPTPSGSGIKAWRYAYDDAGDLVGTSDARGCGVNFTYDGAGRLTTEDYSPCEAHHLAWGAPNPNLTAGYEVVYHYDSDPNLITDDTPPGFFSATPAKFLEGRLVAVFSLGNIEVSNFDGRGRVIDQAVRMAKPGIFTTSLLNRYTPRWYEKSIGYDSADREVSATTGATVAELLGTGNASQVTTSYSARGTVVSAAGSYGSLITSVAREADGLLAEVVYGDAAATTTSSDYDQRRRLDFVQTTRSVPDIWANPPANYLPAPTYPTIIPSHQLTLQDDHFSYDLVSNPTEIDDLRDETEWPDEAKPVKREMQYDSFYRLTRIDYTYEGSDLWKSPFDPENTGAATDPRLGKPMGQILFTNRIAWQTYAYDWLGNTSVTDDDAKGFYDRSIGTVNNSTTKPYQLDTASNETTPGSPINKEGNVATGYDAAGNLTRVHLRRAGTCRPSWLKCNHIFEYRYDEVGRLVRARRYDVLPANLGVPTDPLPGTAHSSEVVNTYNANDDRVIKQTWAPTRNTLYVFDSLELRRAEFVSSGSPPVSEYDLTKWTEVPYLFVNGVRVARIVYHDSTPEIGGDQTHIFFELGDHLGSTNIVIDKVTGELVERGTYQAYGVTESDYRPGRWEHFREDYKFTGKEEDVEVGLQYFGKRFLSAHLQRWVSADPLEIHLLGSGELNAYAYVSGQALKSVDPLGLCGDGTPCPIAGAPAPDNPPEPSSEQLAQERAQTVKKFKEDIARIPAAAKDAAVGARKQVQRAALTVMQGAAMTQGGVTMDPGVRMDTVRTLEAAKPKLETDAEKAGALALEMTAFAVMSGPKVPVGRLSLGLSEAEAAAIMQNAFKGSPQSVMPRLRLTAPGPPALPPFDGRTTHGVLVTGDGASVSLQSGGATAFRNYAASSHVEGKGALTMREGGQRAGTLYHNNTNGTCGYCDAQLPTLLPQSATMRVVPPANAVPNNSRAVAVPKTYTGNSRTPKSPK